MTTEIKKGEILLSDTALINRMESELRRLMGHDQHIKRHLALALFEIKANPKLMQSTLFSVCTAIVEAASLGLEISRTSGQAYLVPFKNADKGLEAQLIVGYRGFSLLAWREAKIKIYSECVFKKDVFSFSLGSHPEIIHKPYLDSSEGKSPRVLPEEFMGAYAVATYPDGYTLPVFHDRAEIEKRRLRSKAMSGPWSHPADYYAMAKKCPIRELGSKFIAHDLAPKLVEVATRDDMRELGLPAGPLELSPGSTSEDAAAEITEQPKPKPKETNNKPKATGEFLSIEGMLKSVVKRGPKVIIATLDSGDQQTMDFSTFDAALQRGLTERVNSRILMHYAETVKGDKTYRNIVSFELVKE